MNPGEWLQSKTSPTTVLEVLDVATDGNIRVRMNGKTINTTERYLNACYRELGDDA